MKLEIGKCYKRQNSWGTLHFAVLARVTTIRSGPGLLVEVEQSRYGTLRDPPYLVEVWPVGEDHDVTEITMEQFKRELEARWRLRDG